MKRAGYLVLGFWLTACLDVQVPEARLACDADQDCPDGWYCWADRRCRSTRPSGLDAGGADVGGDGGPRDSGADGGSMDAGPDGGMPPDAGPLCRNATCDLFPQCGCESGEGCYDTGTEPTCETAGVSPAGVLCDGSAQCAPGLACLAFEGTRSCHPLCQSDLDCPAEGAACVVDGPNLGDVRACNVACDLLTGSGCPVGTRCRVGMVAPDDRLLTVCSPTFVDGGQGDDCAGSLGVACDPGYRCTDPDGSGSMTEVCLRWCDPSAPDCPGGTSCTPFLMVGSRSFGLCL